MFEFYKFCKEDYKRSGGKISLWQKKFIFYFRASQKCKNRFLNIFFRFRWKSLKEKHGIEMSYNTKIGRGFFIGHPFNITINPNSIIGDNCSIHKGVVIGRENRGKRIGAPTIGNNVWIGINAVIVGKITIGNDVLIAPNTYINCDIPSHSVVFGNPCIIKYNEHATKGYINNII